MQNLEYKIHNPDSDSMINIFKLKKTNEDCILIMETKRLYIAFLKPEKDGSFNEIENLLSIASIYLKNKINNNFGKYYVIKSDHLYTSTKITSKNEYLGHTHLYGYHAHTKKIPICMEIDNANHRQKHYITEALHCLLDYFYKNNLLEYNGQEIKLYCELENTREEVINFYEKFGFKATTGEFYTEFEMNKEQFYKTFEEREQNILNKIHKLKRAENEKQVNSKIEIRESDLLSTEINAQVSNIK